MISLTNHDSSSIYYECFPGVHHSTFRYFRWLQTPPSPSATSVSARRLVLEPSAASGGGSGGTSPYTLWLFNIAMGNGPFIEVYPLKMVIFHGYVK